MDPPSSKDPPPCRIIQEGKKPILTTDFYLTTVEPKPWILPTPPSNKDTPKLSGAAAAAADKFTPVIEPDPVQPKEIRLHSWMLYTPQVPVLNLREETITSTLDLIDTFHQLCLHPEEDEKHLEQCCYIVGLGLDCKFIDLLIKRSINIFIKISLYLNFIVLEIISKQTDTLI